MHSREHLGSLKVPEIKALIRKHNLHNAIKGYSSMRKAELVTAFLKFQTPIRAGPAKKSAKSKGSKKPKIMQADPIIPLVSTATAVWIGAVDQHASARLSSDAPLTGADYG